MDTEITRRQFLKRFVTTFTTTALATSLGYVYTRYIEPKNITISKHIVKHPLIPKNFDNVKIVQFSDTHIGHFFDLNDLKKVIDKINDLAPDIVFFTGDLLDAPNQYTRTNDVHIYLNQIVAPLGKYYIYGNHDHGGYGSEIYKDIMDRSQFKLLLNNSIGITKENDEIVIAGLDDCMLGKPDFASTFKNQQATKFTIILVHEPDVAPISEEYGAHLQLSGHTHGGQIQLPFYGPLITPPLGSDFYEGHYKVGDSQMSLYVNRGIGTTRLPFRFLSRPEISLYTLKA